jgi:hypothetical protein
MALHVGIGIGIGIEIDVTYGNGYRGDAEWTLQKSLGLSSKNDVWIVGGGLCITILGDCL